MARKSGKAPKSPDQLARSGKAPGVRLSETDLGKVRGGAADIFAKLGDIKGEH